MRPCVLLTLWFATGAMADQALIAWSEIAQVRSNPVSGQPVVLPVAAAVSADAAAVKVDRVAIEPVELKVGIGTRVCITQFDIATFASGGGRAANVPLSLGMQKDQLRHVTMEAKPNDLCFRPRAAGEYAIRFSSKLPASDGTFRGAQVFVRAG